MLGYTMNCNLATWL